MHWPPEPGDTEPLLPWLGEAPFVLWRALAREFIEMRRRYETASVREAPLLGSHVNDRCSLWAPRRKAPAQLNKFGAVLGSANDRGDIRWPDVIPGLQIGCPARREQPYLEMAESLQIGCVRNSIAVVVTHARISAGGRPICYMRRAKRG